MANSRRFNQLQSRLTTIENTFCPAIRVSGNYTRKERDFIRAYLLLTHAEIESYLEDVAENTAKKSFKKWKDNKTKSNVLLSLVAFCEQKKSLAGSIENRVNGALTGYIKSLKSNHGIKDKNILSILNPIGIGDSDIDQTWLISMNSFGSDRGNIAHSSAKTQQPLDPQTLKSDIQQIMAYLGSLDEKIRTLK